MNARAFIELLDGQGAHASPLGCISDLSAESAGRRVAGFPHSIFDLTFHLNFWMDYDLRRMQGRPLPYPEHASGSWPADAPPVDESRWSKTVEAFASPLGQVEQLARSDSAGLARAIEPTHPFHAERASALGDVLWQLLAHNSYHVGQIVMLRRMLGLWPPRAGGDTW